MSCQKLIMGTPFKYTPAPAGLLEVVTRLACLLFRESGDGFPCAREFGNRERKGKCAVDGEPARDHWNRFWPAEVCLHSTMARLTGPERRRKGRLRLPQTVRVRPSDPQRHDFDEILPTVNTSRDSVYFASKNEFYKEGMRVFVTCPYSDGVGSLNREYLGKVVRVEDLGNNRRGIAVEFLMPV